jgi:glycosyltransferase involved in cell wall biosynthesis
MRALGQASAPIAAQAGSGSSVPECRPHVHVAMVAYADYSTDARIKRYVSALLERDDAVDVFALGSERGTYRDGRLTVTTLGRKYGGSNPLIYLAAQLPFMVAASWHLLRRSFRKKYDVIHVHNMPDILTLSAAPFRMCGTRVILDVHDPMPEAFATKAGLALDSLPIRLVRAAERLSAACAHLVITVNDLAKEVLVRHGIRAAKISIIYNVGSSRIFRPRTRQPNGRELWLGYHGTIARRLGVALIVDALAVLKNDCPDLRFLCVGEGDDLPGVKERALRMGVAHMIEWRPSVPVERLPEVLERVAVGVVGNQRIVELKQNHMLPVKVLEYAAMEVPSILPRLRVLEHYFDASAAFYYEPDNAQDLAATIRAIYANRELLRSKTAGLRAFNAAYNSEAMARRYLTVIDLLAAQ